MLSRFFTNYASTRLEWPTMRHKVALSWLAVVGVIAVTLGWGLYRNSRIAARYDSVSVGASDKEVLSLLGRPSWIKPCGKFAGPPRPNCTEYIYRNSFAPLIPEYYAISFDTSGHVTDKDVYSSP